MATDITTLEDIVNGDVGYYKVFANNGSHLGDIGQCEDGMHNFWPAPAPGYWTAELLKSITAHLDNLNAPYKTQINQYFNDQTLQSSNPANPI